VPAPAARTITLQALAQFPVVVDLSIENDDVTPGGRSHRLAALVAQIEDREAAEAKGDAGVGIDLHPLVVGPPVDERVGHGADQAGDRLGPAAPAETGIENTDDAAQ